MPGQLLTRYQWRGNYRQCLQMLVAACERAIALQAMLPIGASPFFDPTSGDYNELVAVAMAANSRLSIQVTERPV